MKLFKIFFFALLSMILAAALVLLIFGGGFGEKRGQGKLPVPQNEMLLFAHRGLPAYPENSALGYRKAKELGFRALEIDLHKSKDDQMVVFHDRTGERLLGTPAKITELTVSDLDQYRILFNGQKTNSKVLTLKQMLGEFKDRLIIYIDSKQHSFEVAEIVAQLIAQEGVYESTIVGSGDIFFLAYLEYNYPRINTILHGYQAGKEWTWYLVPNNLRPDFSAGFADTITPSFVDWLKEHKRMHTHMVHGVTEDNYFEVRNMGFTMLMVDYVGAIDWGAGIKPALLN